MDPNATLAQIREQIRLSCADDKEFRAFDGLRLAELIDILDYWLIDGGALPTDWNRGGSDGTHPTS